MTKDEGRTVLPGMEDAIKEEARKLGFYYCGIARMEPLEFIRPFFVDFIRRNGHAGLKYLETNLEKRINPALLLEGAKSVITVLMNYFPKEIIPEDDNFIVAKYACGQDYHLLMRQKLEQLTGFMNDLAAESSSRAFVDSGNLAEKTWAQRCGAGWQGKNTLIINKKTGSFSFIGIVLSTLELHPDKEETDHCGDCRRCADACPSGALDIPYQLDIKRCISYYTIEKKEEIPDSLSGKMNNRIFGCDICQDVCPYNRFASPTNEMAFTPAPRLIGLRKAGWISLTPESFDDLFTGTPVQRTGYVQLMKNIRFNLLNEEKI